MPAASCQAASREGRKLAGPGSWPGKLASRPDEANRPPSGQEGEDSQDSRQPGRAAEVVDQDDHEPCEQGDQGEADIVDGAGLTAAGGELVPGRQPRHTV